MNKAQRKIEKLAETLMDDTDEAIVAQAIRLFPKCRVAGEDQNNAAEHIADAVLDGFHVPDDMDKDDLKEELEDLARERLRKTPKGK